ncbi:OB-fold domain-containing protein [Microbacterium sp. NPDC076895]|uniref:Zn-ribbon domain-containing OB-fold protein n=1 Tax=Microbacterium sp. NPDC076895 TaxID=3154957 RepID=UPI00344494E8
MIEVITVDAFHPYPPVVTAATKPFWEALAEGRFVTTRGVAGGVPVFPPRAFDKHTWSRDIEWTELSGRGVLYSLTAVHAAPAVFAHEVPYAVCIVDLDEGVRLATRFLGDVTTPLDTPIELVAVRYANAVTYAARPVVGADG